MKLHHKKPTMLRLIGVFTLIGALSLQFIFQASPALAGQIVKRSLTLQANGLNGGSAPGVAVNHLFNFTVPSAATVGSVVFEYCTKAADVGAETCVAPTGLNAASVTITTSDGIGASTVNAASSTNRVVVQRNTVNSIAANTVVTVQLSGVINPTPTNYTFFVRIKTFATTDGSGSFIDDGVVTASTATPIQLSGVMPESLIFCTGETVPFKLDLTTPDENDRTTIPDCAAATPGLIKFSQLFDPTSPATATSEMAASTNAGYGYVITVNGSTLTSGGNEITPMAATGIPVAGTSQFGLNLKANDTTYFASEVGAEVTPQPSDSVVGGATYRGLPATGYDTVNQFKFTSGNVVANSTTGFVEGPGNTAASDGQVYQVTYMVNVPGSQAAGTYATTLTYICTPTY